MGNALACLMVESLLRVANAIVVASATRAESASPPRKLRVLRAQRPEVALPIGSERNGFAIDQRALDGQGSRRFRDPRQPIGEVGPMSGPQGGAGVLARDQPVAVVLDLVNPLSPFRRNWVLPRRQGAPSAINRQPRPSTQSTPKISRTATVSSDCRRCVLGRRGVGRTRDFIGLGELFIDGRRDDFGGGGEEGRGSRRILHGFLGEVRPIEASDRHSLAAETRARKPPAPHQSIPHVLKLSLDITRGQARSTDPGSPSKLTLGPSVPSLLAAKLERSCCGCCCCQASTALAANAVVSSVFPASSHVVLPNSSGRCSTAAICSSPSKAAKAATLRPSRVMISHRLRSRVT